MYVSADQQDAVVFAAADERVRQIEAVEKSGALLADVESRQRLAKSHLRLHYRTVAGKKVIGRHGGEDQGVNVVARSSGGLQRALRRDHAEIG